MTDHSAQATAASVFGACAKPDHVHLRVLATSDLHMQIWPHDYFHDVPRDQGLANAAGHMSQLASEVGNSLIVDNGDFLQGTPMGDLFADEPERLEKGPHPMIAALNMLGVDTATLGNHEFNYGLPFLRRVLDDAVFPVVCANLSTRLGATAQEDDPLIPPHVVLHRQVKTLAGRTRSIGIGVIGFAPPQTTVWDKKYLENTIFARDIVEAARAHVPRLKTNGAELVLALSHSGIAGDMAFEGMENASVPLAAVDGIDAIVAGHTHQVFPSDMTQHSQTIDPVNGRLNGKPAVMPGVGASHIGVIDLLLDKQDDGWKVLASTSRAVPTDTATPDAEITRAILSKTEPAHQATLAYIRKPVARSLVPLHSYFSAVEPPGAVRLVNMAQIWKARMLLAGGPFEDLPILAAASPFKCGGRGGPDNYTDVPAGDIQFKHLSDMYLYPNQLRTLLITGRDLRDWLEYVAGAFNQIRAGHPRQALLNAAFPGYDADTITGVDYRFDLTQPARFTPEGQLLDASSNRLSALTHDGKDVSDEMQFIVVTNDYRASGDGSFPGAHAGRVVLEHGQRNRDVLHEFLTHIGTVDALPPCNWGLDPIAGASVTLATGPRATAQTDDILRLGLCHLENTSDGFLAFEMLL